MLVVLINLISRLINISGLRISNSKVFSSDYFYLLIESLPKWSANWPFLAFTKYWRDYQNQTLFKSEKWCYLPHFWTDKVSMVTIGNRSVISLHGDSHEITLTVPLNKLWKKTRLIKLLSVSTEGFQTLFDCDFMNLFSAFLYILA